MGKTLGLVNDKLCHNVLHNEHVNDDDAQFPFNFNNIRLHVVELNINHILPKLDALKSILFHFKSVDVFGLYETFLNDSISIKDLHIDGYTTERMDGINGK